MRVAIGAASLLVAAVVLAGLVVATRDTDDVTSDSGRERAIERIADGFDMPRDEVLRIADAFCIAVEESDDLDDYASLLRPAFKDRAEFIFADSTETMVRIGGCEEDFFAIGGTFGDGSPGMERLDDLMAPEADPLPSTPPPEIGSGGPATLSLDTGEVLEFVATCSLADGSRDYTVTGIDGMRRLDLAAHGASDSDGQWYSLTVFDDSTDVVLWESDSLTGDLDVAVEGSTVTATGDFRPSSDLGSEGVSGEFGASC